MTNDSAFTASSGTSSSRPQFHAREASAADGGFVHQSLTSAAAPMFACSSGARLR